uniref:Uncharacterized protein n=1 Tax=Acanthochromis polyacanthus TaxID=80966 RepID=A0A3Q1ELH8_9TELE
MTFLFILIIFDDISFKSRSVQSSPSYRLMKSRSESDLSQPESDEEGYTLSGRRNVDLDLAFSHKKRGKDHRNNPKPSNICTSLKIF